jgi:F-type H+-transporting ATPase subunit epsilon
MAEESLSCRVVTPEREVFQGTVESVSLPGAEGNFGVMRDHTPYMADLDIGEIKIVTADGTRYIACSGGFARVSENEVTVLAETAESPEDIDVERAKSAYRRARERLREEDLSDQDRRRARDGLERAKTRLEVADAEIEDEDTARL